MSGGSKIEREAAAAYNVSVRGLQRAQAVRRKGCDGLLALVRDGRLALGLAEIVARLPVDEQLALVAEGPDAIKARGREIRAGVYASAGTEPLDAIGLARRATADALERLERAEEAWRRAVAIEAALVKASDGDEGPPIGGPDGGDEDES